MSLELAVHSGTVAVERTESISIAAKWSQFQYALYCKYIDYDCEIAKNKVKLQVTKDYK